MPPTKPEFRKRSSGAFMRCRVLGILLFNMFFSLGASLHALYQSNPSTPELLDEGMFFPKEHCVSMRWGYQRDQVFDRKLKGKEGVFGNISQVTQLYNQGILTLNFMDRLDVFGAVGAMSIGFNDHPWGEAEVQFATHDQLTYGGGIRAALINWHKATFGASGSVQYAHPHVKWARVDGASINSLGKARYVEWQVGMALSYHADMFIPYIGVNYSSVSLSLRDGFIQGKGKMVAREPFGLSLGCDLTETKVFDLGLEVQLFSEQAVTLKGDIKF